MSVLLLLIFAIVFAGIPKKRQKQKGIKRMRKYPWKKYSNSYITYGASLFSHPNCTGIIDKGPYVNFGCTDTCYWASGAMSVMLEGDFYDRHQWFPNVHHGYGWSWKSRFSRARIPGFKYDIEQDGPMVITYDFSDCERGKEHERVVVPNRGAAVCHTFSKPVYGFNLKLQRECEEALGYPNPGDPPGPVRWYRKHKFPKAKDKSDIVPWHGQGPKLDGQEPKLDGQEPKLDGATTQHPDGRVPGEDEAVPMPDEELGVEKAGTGAFKKWTKGEYGDWGKEQIRARKLQIKGKQLISQEIKDEWLRRRFFDDWMKPQWEEDQAEPLDHPLSLVPGVMWGDMARDQVGYWTGTWEKKAPGIANKKTHDILKLEQGDMEKIMEKSDWDDVVDKMKNRAKKPKTIELWAEDLERDMIKKLREEQGRWLKGKGGPETVTSPGEELEIIKEPAEDEKPIIKDEEPTKDETPVKGHEPKGDKKHHVGQEQETINEPKRTDKPTNDEETAKVEQPIKGEEQEIIKEPTEGKEPTKADEPTANKEPTEQPAKAEERVSNMRNARSRRRRLAEAGPD